MRIVLDTNVLVRANIKVQGPARELLLKVAYSDHVPITSPFLLREQVREPRGERRIVARSCFPMSAFWVGAAARPHLGWLTATPRRRRDKKPRTLGSMTTRPARPTAFDDGRLTLSLGD